MKNYGDDLAKYYADFAFNHVYNGLLSPEKKPWIDIEALRSLNSIATYDVTAGDRFLPDNIRRAKEHMEFLSIICSSAPLYGTASYDLPSEAIEYLKPFTPTERLVLLEQQSAALPREKSVCGDYKRTVQRPNERDNISCFEGPKGMGTN